MIENRLKNDWMGFHHESKQNVIVVVVLLNKYEEKLIENRTITQARGNGVFIRRN